MSTNWIERQPIGAQDNFWYSAASDAIGQNLIACAYNNRVYISNDYGASWHETRPQGDQDVTWGCVASNNNGSVLLVGDFGPGGGHLYVSTNGGSSWTNTGRLSSRWASATSSADGVRLAACAYQGRVFVSINSGASWMERRPAGNQDLGWQGIAYSADGSLLMACVAGGRFYTSLNDGLSWTERRPAGNTNVNWSSVASSADGSKIVITEKVMLYVSTNGGNTWTGHTLGSDNYLALALNSDCSQIMVGDYGGGLYISTDLGETWNNVQPAGGSWKALASNVSGSLLIAGIAHGRLYTGSSNIYYLNASPTGTPDGLTPVTGYPNFATLQSNITLVDGDTVELVDNGTIDETGSASITINTSITIKSYYGNINKPTWAYYTGANLNFYISTSSLSTIQDIKFICSGTSAQLRLYNNSGDTSSYLITRCSFDNMLVLGNCGNGKVSITNCLFFNMHNQLNQAVNICIYVYYINSLDNFFIDNNVFYGGSGVFIDGY